MLAGLRCIEQDFHHCLVQEMDIVGVPCDFNLNIRVISSSIDESAFGIDAIVGEEVIEYIGGSRYSSYMYPCGMPYMRKRIMEEIDGLTDFLTDSKGFKLSEEDKKEISSAVYRLCEKSEGRFGNHVNDFEQFQADAILKLAFRVI